MTKPEPRLPKGGVDVPLLSCTVTRIWTIAGREWSASWTNAWLNGSSSVSALGLASCHVKACLSVMLFSADVQGANRNRRLKARMIESFTAYLQPDLTAVLYRKIFCRASCPGNPGSGPGNRDEVGLQTSESAIV